MKSRMKFVIDVQEPENGGEAPSLLHHEQELDVARLNDMLDEEWEKLDEEKQENMVADALEGWAMDRIALSYEEIEG